MLADAAPPCNLALPKLQQSWGERTPPIRSKPAFPAFVTNATDHL